MNQKIISTIDKFCKLGFFENHQMQRNKLLERIVSESVLSDFGNINDLTEDPLFEQILLSYDKDIAWFIDDANAYFLSDEVNPEMYRSVFRNLTVISKGIFAPENIKIKECGYCEGRDKRIILNYTINDENKELVFCADGWALMLNFLEQVNDSIEQSSHSFEYIMDAYGACFVFFLNQEQKKYLMEELKWNFISSTNYWADKAMYFKDLKNFGKAEDCFKKAIVNQDNINSVVQYALFLKESSRISESLSVFEVGKSILEKQVIAIENRQWWLDFIDNQEVEIKKQ